MRDAEVVVWVLNASSGICECCEKPASFKRMNGSPFLEVHHLRRLADSGSYTVTNAIGICPNCHRELHYGVNRETVFSSLYLKVLRLIIE